MLPAVNTPQFDWVRSRLPMRAQPVPPIFQPELIARTVLFAAEHPKREYWVTEKTARAVFGNKLIAGVLDHVLARNGFESQQTDEPRDPNAPDALFEPVDRDEDYGAHGRFDGQATTRSWWERVRAAAAPVSPLLQAGTERLERGAAALLSHVS
jgi:hypothetical protein